MGDFKRRRARGVRKETYRDRLRRARINTISQRNHNRGGTSSAFTVKIGTSELKSRDDVGAAVKLFNVRCVGQIWKRRAKKEGGPPKKVFRELKLEVNESSSSASSEN